MDYKSVFTNLCLELQENRSWIKGLCKNPQKSELIHWRQCLLSGGTEACSLGLLETPACIHVIQRLSQLATTSGVLTRTHGFRQNSQKTERVYTHCPTQAVENKIVCTIRPPKRRGLIKTTSIFLWHLYPTPVRIVIHFYPKFSAFWSRMPPIFHDNFTITFFLSRTQRAKGSVNTMVAAAASSASSASSSYESTSAFPNAHYRGSLIGQFLWRYGILDT